MPPPISEVRFKKRRSEESEVPKKRIIIKRSKEVQKRINEKKRSAVEKANKILWPLFNSRQNKMTFDMPPPISEVLIKKRKREKGKGVGEGEKIKETKEKVLGKVDEILRPLIEAMEVMKAVEMKIPQISAVPIKKRKWEERN
ncbi:hypothetical protein Glove_29g75 [Diversispora epigaea]|uniref:Uncharacterized protein n=1 Tax=Diversispora epigaea TaxID=1348612 RepID=A0A397JPI8_9GLOM|nr:hypothetical protein Glove_29g75 [Diversispora epigaea]